MALVGFGKPRPRLRQAQLRAENPGLPKPLQEVSTFVEKLAIEYHNNPRASPFL